MRPLLLALLVMTGCAGGQKAGQKIVACTAEKQWAAADGKAGIHVCFTDDGFLRYVTQPIPPAAPKPEPKKRTRPKVEAEKKG
jgi:hypothetical protein